MKITFYDDVKFEKFYKNIRNNFFSEPFDLFGQRVQIATISAVPDALGGVVEIDIVQVE